MASVDADFAAIDDSLARARAAIAQRDEQRALERAERERAAVNEPAAHAGLQAGLEAAPAARASADQEPDLEI